MFDKPRYESPSQAEIDDWEYKPSRTGMAGETRFAIAVVALLVVAFGYIVWHKLDPTRGQIMANTGDELKPFVFGQTPEEEPHPAPTLPQQPVTNPFVEPNIAEDSPSTRNLAEANPFPTEVPTLPTERSQAEPAPIAENPFTAPEQAEVNQVAQQPQPSNFMEPDVSEPTPLNVAQSESSAPSPFSRQYERATMRPAAQPGNEVPAATVDLFETTDEPHTPETDNPFGETEPVERPKFAMNDDPQPSPFQQTENVQTIASEETKPQPTLVEPTPFEFSPVTPTPEPTPETMPEQELPAFEPLVLPQDDLTPPVQPSPNPQPGNNPTLPAKTPQQPLPAFGDFGDTPPEPRPVPAQDLPAFTPTPTAPPTFEPQQRPPLNSGMPARTVQRDNTVIPPQGNFVEERIYEVQEGDNYWAISRKVYGKARYFSALAEYNKHRIPRPERMKPGMKVLVPDERLLQQQYPKMVGIRVVDSTNAAVHGDSGASGFFVDASGQPMFRVGKGDTLTDIAQNHLGRTSRWVQIYGMNQTALKDANTLKIGTVLRLPRDASQVARAPE